jgi:hypothetical protein
MIITDDGPVRVAEIEIAGVDHGMARDGLAFHREIEAAVTANSAQDGYRSQFTTLPVVGTRQPTLQSARLSGAKLTSSRALPPDIDPLLGDGDGTVPRLSAIPIELSNAYRDTFRPERHSSLQNHGGVLEDIRDRIIHMQTTGLRAIRGPEESRDLGDRPALSVDLDDLYLADEPILVTANVINGEEAEIVLTIVELEPGGKTSRHVLDRGDEHFSLDLSGLPPGGYRIEIGPSLPGPGSPPLVHDVFVVAGCAARSAWKPTADVGVPDLHPRPVCGQGHVVVEVGPVGDESTVGQHTDHIRVRMTVGNHVAAHHQPGAP